MLYRKKIAYLIGLILLLTVIIECMIAGLVQLKGGNQRGKQQIEDSDVVAEGVNLQSGIYQINEQGGKITIALDKQYVHKFQYTYKSGQLFLCDVILHGWDGYGNPSSRMVTDVSLDTLGRSVINVNEKLDKIELLFPVSQIQAAEKVGMPEFSVPETLAPIQIDSFVIDNSFKLNPYRMAYIFSLVLLIGIFVMFRKEIGKRIEVGFVAVYLTTSILIALAMPVNMNSWDEHIHLFKCYNFFEGSDVTLSEQEHNYMVKYLERTGMPAVQSVEEKADMIRYLNQEPVNEVSMEQSSKGISSIGYIPNSLGIAIFKMLGVPFYFSILLGKLIPVIMYACLGYWAIKHAKIGKGIITFAALLPVAVFTTVIYSYDNAVNMFMLVGISVIVSELAVPKEKLSLKNAVIFIVSMVIASAPKAVYIPIILLGLCLPASKFSSRKSMLWIKGAIVLAFLAMMSTFVLPTLIAPPSTGDIRGGNTSTSGQLQLIFSHPFFYAKVLWENVRDTFGRYMMGDSLSMLAYAGVMKYSYLVTVFLVAVTVTDTGYTDKNEPLRIKWQYKLAMVVGIAVTISLIWTALYLSFTEVGKLQIAGVQGRYYLPLVIPFLLLFNTNKIQVLYSKAKYNMAVLGISAALLLLTVYNLFWSYNIV